MKNWKMILVLALPSVLAFASATLTGTLNLIIIGSMGALAIAAVGVSNIIIYNAWALFSGLGHTVNYLVAQSYGAGDLKKAIERFYIALYVSMIMSVLVFVAGLLFAGDILRLIGGSHDISASGEQYLQIRFYAMSFGIVNFAFQGFLRGVGDTKTPMVLSVASNLLMVFLTYTLTYGKLGFPAWGLTGAGIAVLIGEAVSTAGCLYVYFIRMNTRFHTRSRVGFNRGEAKLLLQESGKLGLQEFSLSISMFIFTMFVARLGTHALAANEVALNVMSLAFMPAFAFGSTATILVGQYIGKGKAREARRFGTDTAMLGSLFILVLGLAEFIFADQIARIYTSDAAVFELAAYLIKVSAFLQLFDGLLNFYAGGLRGIGDTTFLMKTSAVVGLLLFVPLSYLAIFVFGWGSIGAWLALYSFLTVFAIAVMIRFYRTDWLSVRIKQAEGAGH